MLREYRLLAALADTDVPHARAVAVCDDPGLMGGCFYLMEYVDGWSPMGGGGWPAPFDTDLEAPARAWPSSSSTASPSWPGSTGEARGLEGFGRPDGFHERQVDRWMSHLAAVQFRDIPGLDVAAAWLRTHQPRHYEPGIMHGDYQFANVMFRHGAPARLAAIVDWEMATVGDPLLDLGWVIQGWLDPDEERTTGQLRRLHAACPVARRAARLLRHRERAAGRRHRLLRDPGPLQAGRGARGRVRPGGAGHEPTTRRWRRSATSCSTWRERAADLAGSSTLR